MDGTIPVTESATFLNNGDVEFAAALVRGQASSRLPIVYVSALPQGGYLLNPRRLAPWLSGMAHVFVEPNRWFSLRLMQEVHRQNAYAGTIGIYWPDGAGPRKYFWARAGQSAQELGAAISDDIRIALVNRQHDRETTWAFLEEVRSKRALEQLRQQGSTELNAYIDQFDVEIEAKKSQLDDTQREIWRLRAEVRRLESQLEHSGGMLKDGSEADLFTGERQSIVVDALTQAVASTRQDSRRWHVLSDVLAANSALSDREAIEAELRSIFEGYRTMDGQRLRRLEKLGFSVTDEGKHYKAIYGGDGRYTFSISKTSSDHRAGLNLLSDIRATIL